MGLNLIDIFQKKTSDIVPEKLIDKLVSEQEALVTFLNPYSYLIARNDLSVYDSFDYIFSDGIALVILFRIFLMRKISRISFDFSSLAPLLFAEAENKELTVFIIGTKPNVIDKAVANLRSKYKNLNIVGYRHGYFNGEEERDKVLQEICAVDPQVVVAGMGTPLQDRFLVDLRKNGWKGLGFTCGGFLHQTARKLIFYPEWINRWHLRFAYRIYKEKGVVKRYLIEYPRFLLYFWGDYLKYCFKKEK